jgi:hypothetical protein
MRILLRLWPALLVLAACGGAKPLGASTADAAGAGGARAGMGGNPGVAGAPADGTGEAGAAGSAAPPAPDGGAMPDGGATPDGGETLDAAVSDAGANDAVLAGDATPPPYDGGIVNVINASNWNETTLFPFSTRRMLVRDEGDPHLVLLDFGADIHVVWKTVTDGPWSRGIQLIGDNQVMGGRPDGYEVFDLATGKIVKVVQGFPNTTSAYRMANGETVLTHGTPTVGSESIRLDFLDATDTPTHSISYPGFGYVRMSRPTRNNTFLVPSDTKLFEGDAKGNVLWTAEGAGWGHVWEPFLMADGDVVLSTFFGSSLDVVDHTTHLVTKQYGGKMMAQAAMFVPNGFAEFQILPNGNLITSNWQSGGGGNGNRGIQVIEFNPAGDVAWYYKQDPTVFASIQGVMVIDGMDPRFLHAMEISPDSTWQPVIPTPR